MMRGIIARRIHDVVSRTWLRLPQRIDRVRDIASVCDASRWGLTAFSVVGMTSVRDHGTFLGIVFKTTLTGLKEKDELFEKACGATARALQCCRVHVKFLPAS
jgi:hypothetical protein